VPGAPIRPPSAYYRSRPRSARLFLKFSPALQPLLPASSRHQLRSKHSARPAGKTRSRTLTIHPFSPGRFCWREFLSRQSLFYGIAAETDPGKPGYQMPSLYADRRVFARQGVFTTTLTIRVDSLWFYASFLPLTPRRRFPAPPGHLRNIPCRTSRIPRAAAWSSRTSIWFLRSSPASGSLIRRHYGQADPRSNGRGELSWPFTSRSSACRALWEKKRGPHG